MHGLGLHNYGICRQMLSPFPCVSPGPDQSWLSWLMVACASCSSGAARCSGSSSRGAGICCCSLAHGSGDFPAAQPAPPPEGFGDFHVLRVEDRADGLFMESDCPGALVSSPRVSFSLPTGKNAALPAQPSSGAPSTPGCSSQPGQGSRVTCKGDRKVIFCYSFC